MSEKIFTGCEAITRANGVCPVDDKDSRKAADLPAPEIRIHIFFAAIIV